MTEIVPLPLDPAVHDAAAGARDDSAERWDRASVHAFTGRYRDYLLAKVAKVFPDLAPALGTGRDS